MTERGLSRAAARRLAIIRPADEAIGKVPLTSLALVVFFLAHSRSRSAFILRNSGRTCFAAMETE
jgi:hypothetical protein